MNKMSIQTKTLRSKKSNSTTLITKMPQAACICPSLRVIRKSQSHKLESLMGIIPTLPIKSLKVRRIWLTPDKVAQWKDSQPWRTKYPSTPIICHQKWPGRAQWPVISTAPSSISNLKDQLQSKKKTSELKGSSHLEVKVEASTSFQTMKAMQVSMSRVVKKQERPECKSPRLTSLWIRALSLMQNPELWMFITERPSTLMTQKGMAFCKSIWLWKTSWVSNTSRVSSKACVKRKIMLNLSYRTKSVKRSMTLKMSLSWLCRTMNSGRRFKSMMKKPKKSGKREYKFQLISTSASRTCLRSTKGISFIIEVLYSYNKQMMVSWHIWLLLRHKSRSWESFSWMSSLKEMHLKPDA